MSIQVASHLARKSIMRDMSGNIINLIDETNGGYIIRNRQVVNEQRWGEICKEADDKREAALASTKAVESPNASIRNGTPTQAKEQLDKVSQLEKKVEGMESKLDAILKAITKE